MTVVQIVRLPLVLTKLIIGKDNKIKLIIQVICDVMARDYTMSSVPSANTANFYRLYVLRNIAIAWLSRGCTCSRLSTKRR